MWRWNSIMQDVNVALKLHSARPARGIGAVCRTYTWSWSFILHDLHVALELGVPIRAFKAINTCGRRWEQKTMVTENNALLYQCYSLLVMSTSSEKIIKYSGFDGHVLCQADKR